MKLILPGAIVALMISVAVLSVRFPDVYACAPLPKSERLRGMPDPDLQLRDQQLAFDLFKKEARRAEEAGVYTTR